MKYIETRELPLDDIETNQYHLREETVGLSLENLMKSIEGLGLVHPIVVRETPDKKRPYTLVAGERRFLAHQKLHRSTIRADLWQASDNEARSPQDFERTAEMMTIVSNIQVEPLHRFEMGRRYLKWINEFDMSEDDIAEDLALPVNDVKDAVRPVRDIAPAALELIEKNADKIQNHHINLLADEARRTTTEGQVRLVQRIISQKDKELAQDPSKLPAAARSVRRQLRKERKEHEEREQVKSASDQERSVQHSDEFKRKKLFEFISAAEEAIEAFRVAEVPSTMVLVDLRSLETRGAQRGRDWSDVVQSLTAQVEKQASQHVSSQAGPATGNKTREAAGAR